MNRKFVAIINIEGLPKNCPTLKDVIEEEIQEAIALALCDVPNERPEGVDWTIRIREE